MAKGPAVVFITRHGARLDAADSQWHLTSPTPYDPPLTYGGWQQAKALGVRISALLHAREAELSRQSNDHAHPADSAKSRRNHRIVIHTSPYLRCVQTSIGIAAGISSFHPDNTPTLRTPQPRAASARTAQPKAKGWLPLTDRPVFERSGPKKIPLRIDAFLGEWLSEEYFKHITPPPVSALMVHTAKNDLSQPSEYVEPLPTVYAYRGHFPGGWAKTPGSPATPTRTATHDGNTFPSPGSLAQAAHYRERSSSQGSVAANASIKSLRLLAAKPAPTRLPDHIYSPPTPSFAASPSDQIPRGYVAHARDACVAVDFQWDSMRAPQEWGDGGEYGDEWSTMHRRFRKGLAGMMQWYKEHGVKSPGSSSPLVERAPANGSGSYFEVPAAAPAEDEEDLVLILVTHGAGCNALLGAISNQPILLDVGLASLSMAERRDEPRRPSDGPPVYRRPSVIDVGMSDEYDLKITASTAHLLAGADPAKLQSLLSTPERPTRTPSDTRRRYGIGSTSPGRSFSAFKDPFGQANGVNGVLRSARRSYSSDSSSRSLANPKGAPTSPSPGLWPGLLSPIAQESHEEEGHSPGADMVLRFHDYTPAPSTPQSKTNGTTTNGHTTPTATGSPSTPGKEEESDQIQPLRSTLTRSATQTSPGLWGSGNKTNAASQGLWGPPRYDDLAERAPGPKRRWTINESE